MARAKLTQPGRKNMYLHSQADCWGNDTGWIKKRRKKKTVFRTLTRCKMIFFCHIEPLVYLFIYFSVAYQFLEKCFQNIQNLCYHRRAIYFMLIDSYFYYHMPEQSRLVRIYFRLHMLIKSHTDVCMCIRSYDTWERTLSDVAYYLTNIL